MTSKTPLYDRHTALEAKLAPFAGWEMPIQYKGILTEHRAVREHVGLFDVSHMGQIMVDGPDAEQLLDYVSTNRISGKVPGSATYTVWCDEDGGSVDDVIVYKIADSRYFVVVNAGNRDKDYAHLTAQARLHHFNVDIRPLFSNRGILSLQGPSSFPLLNALIPETTSLKPMHIISLDGGALLVSRTGYTGAGGFEIYGSDETIIKWWDLLLDKGKPYGILPVGLGARDTLRLEMGFALYGHELTESIAPSESVSAWTIKWDKQDFLGKKALEYLEKSSKKRYANGVKILDKAIMRQGCPIMKEGVSIGEATSGGFSPTLECSIGLVLSRTPLQNGDLIDVQIRSNICQARVEELPFVRKIA